VSGLPFNLPAALFIVVHIPPNSCSALPTILSRAGPLPTTHAVDGEAIQQGCTYSACPDHHLVIQHQYVRVTHGPKENRFLPEIDVLFRSAAYAYGPRVIGMILSGQLDDGTAGLWAVKDRGGLAIVQEPDEALYSSMPFSAMQHVTVDNCLALAEIAPLLEHLVGQPAAQEAAYPVSKVLEVETGITLEAKALESGLKQLGQLSPYTCPECHGVLLQLQDGGIMRFRCHTGHAFSAKSLLADMREEIEQTLWSTVRGLEGNILLLQHLARHAEERNDHATATSIRQKLQHVVQHMDRVRQVTIGYEQLDTDPLHPEPDAD
jgi:two-component system, chemotaxis family, protein-glutamate methylesterase/glutaminase